MMNSTNSLSRFFSRVKGTLLLLVALFATIGIHAQTHVNKTFTACALNIDGLPQTFASINLNPDGPGSEGTQAIGRYIVDKGIDVLGLSEDFNYDGDLRVGLDGKYLMGSWSGRINVQGIFNNSIRFACDGLQFLVKNDGEKNMKNETRVSWNANNGKFTNGADELVTKGYRFYVVDLGNGVYVDFYILHMDAETDVADNEARASQLTQLCNAIRANSDGRPKIIMGDTNCRYTRDNIKSLLIDPLVSDGNEVKDAWIQLCQNGVYPSVKEVVNNPDGTYNTEGDMVVNDKLNPSDYISGEIVDKVIYINPDNSSLKLKANTIEFDCTGYQKDETSLLGDHVPVIVNFTIEGELPIVNLAPNEQSDFWEGESVESLQHDSDDKAYLFNVGNKTFITTANTCTVTDIENAVMWRFKPESNGIYTICHNNNERLYMYTVFGAGFAGIRTESATKFSVELSDTYKEGLAYKFKNDGRFFNVDTDKKNEYTAAKSSGNYNDWLLISDEQKQAYITYEKTYNTAKDLLDTAKDIFEDESELKDDLEQALLETMNTKYSTSESDTKKLQDIIDKIKNRQGYVVTITDGNKSGEYYYATLCLPWNAWVPQGVATYTGSFKQDSGDTRYITLNEYNNADKHINKKTVIPAGIGGYILKTTETGTFTFYKTEKLADDIDANCLKGNPSMENVMPTDTEKGNVYVLAKKDRGLGFYNLAANNAIKHNCAYIVIEPEKVTQIKRVSFLFDDMPTAIDKAEAAINANATAVYGVAGEQRSALRRGVNIVRMSDGTVRKVAVK